jgi:LmbE family N-acetylglucosaminyl deacetylase
MEPNATTGPLGQQTCMVIEAHADDASHWCGGQMIKWAEQGHRVILVRATNDENDSIGLTREQTMQVNAEQLHEAAAILGVADVVDLGFSAERLTDSTRIPLREALVHLYRKYRPYRTLTFDPYSVLFENNQDHLHVGRASDEASWMAMCDKYVPDDLEAGLALHGVFERWYFGRQLPEVTDWTDISDVVEKKIDATTAHRAMLRNTLLQLELMSSTAGISIPLVQRAAHNDLRAFVEYLVKSTDAAAGARHGCAYAEEFRIITFAASPGPLLDLLPREGGQRVG